MKRIILITALAASGITAKAQLSVESLRTQGKEFTWTIHSGERNVVQTACEVRVNGIWAAHKKTDEQTIAYAGPELKAGESHTWQVRVWDNHAHVSPWSAPATYLTPLEKKTDWKGAQWIAYEALPDSEQLLPGAHRKKGSKIPDDVLPEFEKTIPISHALKRATAFVCGLGQFEFYVNGQKAGDHFLDPGWTRYDKEAVYVPFDITGLLRDGDNTVNIALGNGFLYTPSQRYHKLAVVFAYPKVIARIRLEYADGHTQDVVTDTTWQTAPSKTTFSTIYGGEDYDATLEQTWRPAIGVDGPPLHEQVEEPLTVTQTFEPIEQKGNTYDLGQNISGIPEITVRGNKGDTVRIFPGELLNDDGSVNQKATGSPYYFTYICKGGGDETWRPKFTYYGFRYLEVKTNVRVMDIRGLHTRNAADSVGWFTCSNPLFNRINTLIRWAIQNNMASVLTDCPTREKLGWLEQTHLMGNAVRYNYDFSALYRKMAHDMTLAQTPDGLMPEIAPEFTVFGEPFRDSPEWGSACILVPWDLYRWYGDKDALRDCYPMMRRYMAYLARKASNHILMEGLGDWYDIGPKHPGVSQLTPQGLTATATYYQDAAAMAQIARVLGSDPGEYEMLAGNIKKAFNERFPYNDSASQTASAMSLQLGLTPREDRAKVLDALVRDIRQKGLTAGDVGFHYVVDALKENGRDDVLFDLTNQSDKPGYGYQLKKGATALTESWQALPSASNDHLMLGHIMEWFYEGIAGINTNYKNITIAPKPVGDLTAASAGYRSSFGTVASAWSIDSGGFTLKVHIPVGVTAQIILPHTHKRIETGSGDYTFTEKGQVPDSVMHRVYEKVKTPYKYGLVVAPKTDDKKVDCPTVFRKDNHWYMTYLVFNGRGYETWLAKSEDLLHWNTLGRVLPFPKDSTRWDANQQAGYIGLIDPTWGGSYQPEKYQKRYWMSYFGGNTPGYEKGLLSISLASTDKDPAVPHEWDRFEHPVLSPRDTDVAWWDNHTQYKELLFHDKDLLTGHPFLLYYNANGDSIDKKRGAERIGLAVSDDMVHWKRFGKDPVLNHGAGITGDPDIQKMGDLYVMFYFGAFWKGASGAFNRFACSYDLVHWTDWKGPNLIQASEPYDETFAHKSCVVSYKGVVYHFYCAVDKANQRGIALATSKDLGKSTVNFPTTPRKVIAFDDNWRFNGKIVNLPHDWSISGPFEEKNNIDEGALPTGFATYTKTFEAQKDWTGKKVYIEFDGVYKNSAVYLNGRLLGKRPSGYASFRYELTGLQHNDTIRVDVDNTEQPDSRWYTGSGIYRHVRLIVLDKTSIDPEGIFVTNPAPGRVHVEMSRRARLKIIDAAGNVVAESNTPDLEIRNPLAWSPEHPNLYRLTANDEPVATFGLRTIKFDRKGGFLLNGKRTQIKGVCLHQDLGALGAAVDTQAMEKRLKMLKAMGCNAIRTAHNPPDPAFLDLCDKMGFLVMDEAFDVWKKKKTKNDYHLYFDEWHKRDLQDMIKRDRNHPSIIAWSIGNEIREQFDTSGLRLTRELADEVRALDTTRPVTAALTEPDAAKNYLYRSGALDVFGLNYHLEALRNYHLDLPLLCTEDASGLASRGDYEANTDSVRYEPAGPKEKTITGDHTVSSGDNVAAYWGATQEATLDSIRKYPFVAGMFVWSGYDYLGEPTPYGWPSRSSYFGLIDLAGFPKDVYYLYQSVWSDRPVLHILPHWNWQPGQVVDVKVYYNQADAVELFLNGRSLGRRSKGDTALHVSWKVPFEKGVLRAVALKNGKAVRQTEVRTAGPADHIVLEKDATTRGSLYFITAKVVDKEGNLVPKADNELHIKIQGQARLEAADNGQESSLEPFQGDSHRAYNGLCALIIKATGQVAVAVTGEGLKGAVLREQ